MPLRERGDLDPEVLRWVNRLSDFFFVAARLAGQHAAQAEEDELTYARPDGRGSQRTVGRNPYTRAVPESASGDGGESGDGDRAEPSGTAGTHAVPEGVIGDGGKGDDGDKAAPSRPAEGPAPVQALPSWAVLCLGVAIGVLVSGRR